MATPKIDWEQEWYKEQKEVRKLAKRANQRLVRLEQAAAKRPNMKNILSFAYKSAMKDIKSTGKQGKQRWSENPRLVDMYDSNGRSIGGTNIFKQNVLRLRVQKKMITEFLGAASSTIGQGREYIKEGISKTIGIKRIWDKSNKTINQKFLKKYDLRMSDDDMKRFFESKKQAKLEQIVGSSLMFVVASVMKKNNLKSNKRELEKFMKSHIDLSKYDLSPEDIKSKKGESYKEYLDRLRDYVDYTGDEVLDDMITKALKEGVNVNNIFI